VGADTNTATTGQTGIKLVPAGDGNNYIDLKTFSGGLTYFRGGAGAEAGYSRQLVSLNPANGNVNILGSTPSSSATTGALTVAGGLGISGGVNVTGAVGLGSTLNVTGTITATNRLLFNNSTSDSPE